jgi:hypothetical protein
MHRTDFIIFKGNNFQHLLLARGRRKSEGHLDQEAGAAKRVESSTEPCIWSSTASSTATATATITASDTGIAAAAGTAWVAHLSTQIQPSSAQRSQWQ